jgi:gas vesicle protein
MKTLLGLLLGITLGALVGIGLVTLFSPMSSEELRQNLKRGYEEALDAARKASAVRREELQAQLAQMQKDGS